MAKNETTRLKKDVLQADHDGLIALQSIPNYQPANANYMLDRGLVLANEMEAAQTAEVNAENALKTARDNANAAEWNLHNFVLGVKDQVKAQFGADSNELQTLGMKKKSEYKTPKKKAAK